MERPSRSRWPVGFLGMLAIVAIVESTLSRHPLHFSDTASLSWQLAAEAVPREAKRSEVVVLGDSLVKIGVIPEVVHAVSGRSTYNFAMAQAPAPATYFMLRRLIEAGGRPSSLVVDFKPSVLAGGPRFSLRHWQSTLDLRESFELARESSSPRMLVEIELGRVLPSYRDRLEIREAVRSSLLGETAPTYSTNRLALRNWSINRGAHLNSSRSPFPGDVGPEVHKKLLSDGGKCHRINAIYVDKLLTLAEAHQIPVVWLIPPLPPQLQVHRERSGVDAAYVAFARSIQAKHPGLTVVDGRHSGYDDSTFADHTHLNGRGSIAMSRDLAEILRGPESRPRWVDLPRFSDRPGTFPVEDVDQSRVALEAEATRR
jgi:hypothetical protein